MPAQLDHALTADLALLPFALDCQPVLVGIVLLADRHMPLVEAHHWGLANMHAHGIAMRILAFQSLHARYGTPQDLRVHQTAPDLLRRHLKRICTLNIHTRTMPLHQNKMMTTPPL